MIATEQEIDEQIELYEQEEKNNKQRLYTEEEIRILFSILNDEIDNELNIEQVDNLLDIIRFLKLNNGLISQEINLTINEINKIYNYLERLKNSIEQSNLVNISNYHSEEEKTKDSILTKEEENTLIATYGRSDIYLYAIRLDYLNAISISNDDNNKFFNHSFTHRSLVSLGESLGKTLSEIGDNYTLIKYVGNNKFEEYYTGKTITTYRNASENAQSFSNKLEEYRQNPLCILIGLKQLKIADSNIENKIIANVKNREKIENFINKASVLAKKELEKDVVNMIDIDKLYADEEYKIYEFKKVIRR